ncbi:MAG: aminotransferase, partial [Desulfobacteraceae bacterium]|nr:aminotransferase [Desulfobacteraceae bacterium]
LENEDFDVYIQITRGSAPRTHSFPVKKVSPTIYMETTPFLQNQAAQKNGVKIILERDTRGSRCDIKSIGRLPNVLAAQNAKEQGAVQAVFVRDHVVTEGASSTFCAVFDGVLITYPLNHHILPGITRKVVLELCHILSIPIEENPITEASLEKADEMMVLSTTKEITPVVRINKMKVKDGRAGPVTRKLQQAFNQLVIDF